MPSRLSPQWLCGNSCTWAHDVRLHHVPKCMGCHKAIVVITRRAHCFHDNLYIQWSYIYIVATVIIWILPKILCEIFHHVIISHKDIVSRDHYLIFVKDQGGSWFELNIRKCPSKILRAIQESTQHSLKSHKLQNICSPR